MLTAAYAGAVVTSNGSISNNGSMSNGFDVTSSENYYQWTTTQSINQSENIVVQISLPSNFKSLGSLSVDTNSSNTSEATISATLLDSTNTPVNNWNNCNLTPTTVATWQSIACPITSGKFNPNGVVTLILHLNAQDSAWIKSGKIVLSYNSAY